MSVGLFPAARSLFSPDCVVHSRKTNVEAFDKAENGLLRWSSRSSGQREKETGRAIGQQFSAVCRYVRLGKDQGFFRSYNNKFFGPFSVKWEVVRKERSSFKAMHRSTAFIEVSQGTIICQPAFFSFSCASVLFYTLPPPLFSSSPKESWFVASASLLSISTQDRIKFGCSHSQL